MFRRILLYLLACRNFSFAATTAFSLRASVTISVISFYSSRMKFRPLMTLPNWCCRSIRFLTLPILPCFFSNKVHYLEPLKIMIEKLPYRVFTFFQFLKFGVSYRDYFLFPTSSVSRRLDLIYLCLGLLVCFRRFAWFYCVFHIFPASFAFRTSAIRSLYCSSSLLTFWALYTFRSLSESAISSTFCALPDMTSLCSSKLAAVLCTCLSIPSILRTFGKWSSICICRLFSYWVSYIPLTFSLSEIASLFSSSTTWACITAFCSSFWLGFPNIERNITASSLVFKDSWESFLFVTSVLYFRVVSFLLSKNASW